MAWPFRAQRDGESSLLEAQATGIPADTMNGLATIEDDPSAKSTGRRDRALDGGDQVLRDGLAEKVLHGWLQNRHQTLYPLTVNLRQLDEGQRLGLARWLAVSMLADRQPKAGSDAARQAATRAWFTSVGADAALLAVLDDALANPPALSHALADIVDGNLSAYAYVVALVALDPREPASLPFLDYVAARLALPTTIVRSATRRYRQ